MKKILVSLSLIVVLISLFTIVVSAKTVISEKNIEKESGDIVATNEYKVDDSHYYQSVSITYLTNDGQTKSGKFYYYTDGWWNNQLQITSVYIPSDFDFSQMIYLFDKVDIDGNGAFEENRDFLKGTSGGGNSRFPSMKWYTYDSFDSQTGQFTNAVSDVRNSIQAISYSKYLAFFGNYFLAPTSSLKTVTYNGKEPVEGTVFISPNVNEIMNATFGGDGNSLTANTITPAYNRVVFEARNGSLSLGQYAFCRGQIEEVVFLKGTYYLKSREIIALQFYAGTSTPSLKSVVVENGVTFASGEITWNMDSYDIRFIGEEADYSYDNYSACLKNASGTVIYEELCYVYGHKAEADDKNCQTALGCAYKADGCNYVYVEASEHTSGERFVYENGYLSVGKHIIGCTNDGCEYGEISELPALVVSKGYSQDSTSNALVLGLSFNKDAIKAYENYLGTEISYGMVASIEQDDLCPLKNNGEAKDGTVKADIKDAKYSILQLKITNIDNKDKLFHCAGYFIIGNEITYVNGEETASEAIKVSYNNYTGKIKE